MTPPGGGRRRGRAALGWVRLRLGARLPRRTTGPTRAQAALGWARLWALLAVAVAVARPVQAQEALDPAAVARFLDGGAPPMVQANILEAVDLIGNHRTTRSFIIGLLGLRVDAPLDEDRVEEARLTLLNTGLFADVEMSLRRGTARGRVILVVELQERNTLMVDELYLGTSEVSPLFGGLGLTESNLFGEGIVLSGRGAAGRGRRGGRLQLFVPRLSATPLQLSTSLRIASGREPLSEDAPTDPQLNYTRFGGTFGFGLITAPSQRVALSYRLEGVSVGRLRGVPAALAQQAPSVSFDESVVSTLRASWEHDTQDSPLLPTRGHRVRFAVEVGTELIGSSYEFSKYTLELSQALPLRPRHGLRLDLFSGFIQGQAPFFDQFFPRDHSYFMWGRRALPRGADLNFSESNNYEDVILSLGSEYYYALHRGGTFIPRLIFFAGVRLTAASSLQEQQRDPTHPRMPVSFDLGLKLETKIGLFTLSGAYVADLVW